MSGAWYNQIPKVLAVLAYDGDYHYIDKLSNSHSKSLVLYYLREALRDFNSLKRSPPKDVPNKVLELMGEIDVNFLEREIDNIRGIEGTQNLREVISTICSKALAVTSQFIKMEVRG